MISRINVRFRKTFQKVTERDSNTSEANLSTMETKSLSERKLQ